MKTLILLYIITQLITTAYGICVIETLKPIIETQLHNKGYVLKNKNSLYKFDDTLINILKGFIPFYYMMSAVNLIKGNNPIEREVQSRISSGEYITKEELASLKSIPKQENNNSNNIEQKIEFEKPEKYTARKVDNTLYDTYVTPVEYIAHEVSKDDKLSLTPFTDPDRVVEHVMVKEEVTKDDIVKAITELNEDELEALSNSIITLQNIKRRNNSSLSLKDVA